MCLSGPAGGVAIVRIRPPAATHRDGLSKPGFLRNSILNASLYLFRKGSRGLGSHKQTQAVKPWHPVTPVTTVFLCRDFVVFFVLDLVMITGALTLHIHEPRSCHQL